eukprot:15462733-Alexandrium_andersonii.AAC.1
MCIRDRYFAEQAWQCRPAMLESDGNLPRHRASNGTHARAHSYGLTPPHTCCYCCKNGRLIRTSVQLQDLRQATPWQARAPRAPWQSMLESTWKSALNMKGTHPSAARGSCP